MTNFKDLFWRWNTNLSWKHIWTVDKQSKGAKLKKNTSIIADSSDLQWTGFLKFNCQISFRIKPAWRQKFWSTPRQNLSCAVCIFSGWNFAPTLIYSFAHLLCKVLLNLKVFEQNLFWHKKDRKRNSSSILHCIR